MNRSSMLCNRLARLAVTKRASSAVAHKPPYVPAVYDALPIPHLPYAEEYARLNAKFNMYLLGSVALLAVGTVLCLWTDTFDMNQARAPTAYRKRTNDFYKPNRWFDE